MHTSRYHVLPLLLIACGNPDVRRVEINGMDCRVNTAKMGGEACCKTEQGWKKLDASGTASTRVITSGESCDPRDP